MDFNPLRDAIDAERIKQLATVQYSERLVMSATVPATGEIMARTAVSNLGHFLCLYWTGSFTTLNLAGAPPVITDTAINYLAGKLIDGAGQRQLFNDFIPFNLLFSPGREKSPLAVAPVTIDPAPPLVFPQEFPYLFLANTEIQMQARNTATTDNAFTICFHGIRIKTFGRQ